MARGWRVNLAGTDTATAGQWQRGDPAPTTTAAGRKQPDGVTSGRYGFVTGLAAGSSAASNDLDGGLTTTTSPSIALPATAGQKLQFRWSFGCDASATAADEFRVEVLDGSAATTVLVTKGAGTERNAGWHLASLDLGRWAGRTIRLRFSATDGGGGGIVEAAFDDARVTQPQ